MLSASAKPALRVASYLGPVKSYFRNVGNQTRGLSRHFSVTSSSGQSTQLLHRATATASYTCRLPTWSSASLNSHRSLHVSSRCSQDEFGDGHHSDTDEDVMQGSHDQTSQTVIHYGRGGIASIEDLLYHILSGEDGMLSVGTFLEALGSKGLRTTDPRLAESMDNFRHKFSRRFPDGLHDCMLDQDAFKECITDNIVLIGRALQNKFIIPDFENFTPHIEEKYYSAMNNTGGQVASYIPQLARQDPNHWGVSLCTVDGQRFSIGNTETPFCLQSSSKAPMYTLALTLHGPEYVHQYIGFEPSGRPFNDLCLNPFNKPHNPMLNSGAMVTTSLIQSDVSPADRFDFIMQKFKEMAGGEHLGFCNATFLSEKSTGFRNYAMGYLMEEHRCFPPGHTTMETAELYFQVCSMQVTCESGSVIAATLANGGICPITGQKVFEPFAVRDALTLMSSCGMYDYSGQFAFQVGMPAKSGVSGAIIVVIPNVMGMMLYSPPLDKYGNSVRGMQFCKDLVTTFNFHNYDDLQHVARKLDPRRVRWESRATQMINLLFAAYNGDVSALRQYFLQGTDMSSSDYDARTALHLASAEGHKEVVTFLLEKCNVSPVPQDRWGHTPLDEAENFGHHEIADILKTFSAKIQS